MSFLLRVRLPDRPGALGALATALGRVGADIDSIVVVDRVDGTAVDDLLVDLPPGGLAEALLTAVHSVDGAYVESLQRHAGHHTVADDLGLLDDLAARPSAALQTLATGLPDALRAGWAVAVDTASGEVLAASPAAPSGRPRPAGPRLDGVGPLQVTDLWPDPGAAGPDAELLAAPLARPTVLAVVGRNGGPAFRPSERLRLGHLCSLAGAVLHGAGVGRPAG